MSCEDRMKREMESKGHSWTKETVNALGSSEIARKIGWVCYHCKKRSSEYTGSVVDGSARCPNCHKYPVGPTSLDVGKA